MALSLRLALKDGANVKGKAQIIEKEALLRETSTEMGSLEPVGRNRKILVVDDNPVVLKAFELKLKASGFVVATAGNGATVARTAEEENPDLIILDINLATDATMDWSGFTIMQWLKRFPQLAGIPVILITGTDVKAFQEKALTAGAVALMQKPVDYRQLLSTILEALDQSATPPVAG